LNALKGVLVKIICVKLSANHAASKDFLTNKKSRKLGFSVPISSLLPQILRQQQNLLENQSLAKVLA
jgi:hypothetical protein